MRITFAIGRKARRCGSLREWAFQEWGLDCRGLDHFRRGKQDREAANDLAGNTECLPEGNFQADIEEPCANAMQNEDGSVEMVVIFDLKGDK